VDGEAVAAGHEQLAERLAALRDAVPTDELDRLLGGAHRQSDDGTVR
jgi:hypothetical protein